jgi:putative ABC transport system substrate-binding protein
MGDRWPALVVATVCAVFCAPLIPLAQDAKPSKIARIGRLSPLSAVSDAPNVAAFRKGLQGLGWVEGQNFVLETRFADGNPERLPGLAAQLVREGVDLILVGSNQGVLAVKSATGTIPIVMVTTGDPVSGGLVASLARPGGNITGVTALGQVLAVKRLELLKETVPAVTRLAVLANPTSPYTGPFLKERESVARTLGLQLQVVEAHEAGKLEQAFAAMTRERAGALLVLTDVMFINHRRRIVDLAAKSRLPAIYPEREFVGAGGLMFYGASLVDMYAHAAAHADKTLKGTKPADLPVEQPTSLELVINLKTAKALGLTIPSSVLVRADQVVQ